MGCSNSPKTKENENSQKIIQYQEEFNIDLAKNKNIEKKESDDKARNSQDMLKINDKKGKKRKEEEEGKRKEYEEEEQRRKEEEEKKRKKEEEQKRKEEEEQKRKEEEEKKRKEEEEQKRKEEEEKKRKEEEEKKRKEEEIQLKKRQINLYLLLKNLEAVNNNGKDIEDLRENIHKVFESLSDTENKDFNDLKKEIISNVLDKINKHLGIDNNDNDDTIKNILIYSFEEKNNILLFQEYLDTILNSVNNYYKINNEDDIINYIIDYLNPLSGLLTELLEKYKNRDFIDYEDFAKIIKDNEIAMDEIAMEYLIFRMKINKGKSKMKFKELNIKTFIQFFYRKNSEEQV